jgi:hypothetical protein
MLKWFKKRLNSVKAETKKIIPKHSHWKKGWNETLKTQRKIILRPMPRADILT